MAHIEALEFFESIYLNSEIAQRQSFKDKCYALQSFLDDSYYSASQRKQQVQQDFIITNSTVSSTEKTKSSIYEALDKYGFNASLAGTKYIVFAIITKSEKQDLDMMTLYKICGQHFGKTSTSIESSCRYACQTATHLDKSLCTYYENVTPCDIVFKLAGDIAVKKSALYI